jgi:hypothetical protein
MLRTMLALMLLAACGGASAQSLYKCTVDGKVTYTGSPCKSGDMKAIEVPKAPPRNVNRDEELKRQKTALTRLEKARAEREQVEATKAARNDLASNEERCNKMRLEQKTAEENADRAPGFKRASMRETAKKMSEALAAECGS